MHLRRIILLPQPPTPTGGSWEAEEQVDLEWFDTEAFFGILLRQSLSVTAKLSQTKEEVTGSSRQHFYLRLEEHVGLERVPSSGELVMGHRVQRNPQSINSLRNQNKGRYMGRGDRRSD